MPEYKSQRGEGWADRYWHSQFRHTWWKGGLLAAVTTFLYIYGLHWVIR